MPVTLVAYTWLTKYSYPVDAFYLVVMIVAVVIDLGFFGGQLNRLRRRETKTGGSLGGHATHRLAGPSQGVRFRPSFWNQTE